MGAARNHLVNIGQATISAGTALTVTHAANLYVAAAPLATGAGTLYIERASRRDAMRVVHHMADSLRSGDVVAVFPEGTTSDGLSLLPFHANLLQGAIAAEAPVQPVALRFIDAASGETSQAPCYIGDDTLVGSLWRTVTGPGLTAVVSFGEPQLARGRDRRAWAADLREAVDVVAVAHAMQDTAHWCDILILHLNVKNCQERGSGSAGTLRMSRS